MTLMFNTLLRRASLVTLLATALVACVNERSTRDADPAAGGTDTASKRSIAGRVVLDGVATPAERIRLDADPQCLALAQGDMQYDESLLTGEGRGVPNAFVYVQQGLSQAYAPPEQAVVLDQQKCRYVPRVLGLQVGQTLTIRNSDPLLHTVRADASANARFNVATPLQGMEVSRTFLAAEVMVPVKCDMHPWMHAYVGVLDHPFFAVTDGNGAFTIANLPPGTFTIGVWHERLGVQSQEITLGADQPAPLSFVYQAPEQR